MTEEERWRIEDELREEYKEVIEDYQNLSMNAENLYSIAINQEDINNKYTEQCIDKCFEAINLFPKYKEFHDKFFSIQPYKSSPVACGEITVLAKLYEKQKDYIKAINICIFGINLEKDFEPSYLLSRIGRLIKKYNKENDKKIHFDDEKLVLYDGNGEVL